MKRKAVLLSLVLGSLLPVAPRLAAQCGTTTCPAQTLGTIELPADGATVFGWVRVQGFALDGNLVSNVNVYVDGTDSVDLVTEPGGANINLPRPDVMQAFPAYLGTPGANPGFEIGFLASNYSNGTHTIYIQIIDVTGCCYFLAPVTVTIDNTQNQPPFGNVDLPMDQSAPQSNGVLQVVGWALGEHQVDHVDVYIDGLIERQAVMGQPRPDIAADYPGDLQAITSGFILNVDSTTLTNGVHTVSVKAVDILGLEGLLGVRQIQVFNNAPNLPPFGEVEVPLLNSTWFGNCFAAPPGGPSGQPPIIDVRYVQYVSGWVLDTSVAADRGGTAYVQLQVDGVVVSDTRLDCHREILLANSLINCYGYYRPDIEVLYPGFPVVPNAGFRFVVDPAYLITQLGMAEGSHILSVIAADMEDQITQIGDVPVVMLCGTQTLDEPPIGYVDSPTEYQFINGVFPVIGWALDLNFVAAVRIMIDGVVQIDAVSGLDTAQYGFVRPDVTALYPNYPQSIAPGFRFYLDTTKISNSEHDLLIEVQDALGNRQSAGTRRIIVDNQTLVR